MDEPYILVLISANSEWKAIKELLSPSGIQSTPLGETFIIQISAGASDTGKPGARIRFFHGGWGKISAAATAQYAIDNYHPHVLFNLGTCGGFAGHIERGTIILVTKTIVYDIIEQMTSPEEAISHYSTELDPSWLSGDWKSTIGNHWSSVISGPLVSADRDILPADIPMLVEKYAAAAADWESGAIAWVAKRNSIPCLILRGVTDLVGEAGGEAYGNVDLFQENTRAVMKKLIEQLPAWLEHIRTDAAPKVPLFDKVDCIRLYVPDLESGLAFYRDRLDHKLIWRTPQAAGLQMPGTDAEIVLQTEQAGQEVDITVVSADNAARRFAAAGGTVVVPPFDIQIGRCTVVSDPWGNQLTLLDTSKGLLATDKDGNVTGNK